MDMTEILWIREELAKQGFTVSRTNGGLWVIRGNAGLPVGVMSRDADQREWHNVLRRLATLGWIVWPPE